MTTTNSLAIGGEMALSQIFPSAMVLADASKVLQELVSLLHQPCRTMPVIGVQAKLEVFYLLSPRSLRSNAVVPASKAKRVALLELLIRKRHGRLEVGSNQAPRPNHRADLVARVAVVIWVPLEKPRAPPMRVTGEDLLLHAKVHLVSSAHIYSLSHPC